MAYGAGLGDNVICRTCIKLWMLLLFSAFQHGRDDRSKHSEPTQCPGNAGVHDGVTNVAVTVLSTSAAPKALHWDRAITSQA